MVGARRPPVRDTKRGGVGRQGGKTPQKQPRGRESQEDRRRIQEAVANWPLHRMLPRLCPTRQDPRHSRRSRHWPWWPQQWPPCSSSVFFISFALANSAKHPLLPFQVLKQHLSAVKLVPAATRPRPSCGGA